jgi:hypothetical protein
VPDMPSKRHLFKKTPNQPIYMINESVQPNLISGQQAIYISRVVGFVYFVLIESVQNRDIKTSLCSKEPEEEHHQAGGADLFPGTPHTTAGPQRVVTYNTTGNANARASMASKESLKFIPYIPLNVNTRGRFDSIFTKYKR